MTRRKAQRDQQSRQARPSSPSQPQSIKSTQARDSRGWVASRRQFRIKTGNTTTRARTTSSSSSFVASRSSRETKQKRTISAATLTKRNCHPENALAHKVEKLTNNFRRCGRSELRVNIDVGGAETEGGSQMIRTAERAEAQLPEAQTGGTAFGRDPVEAEPRGGHAPKPLLRPPRSIDV
jgi:hypothetical protein